MKRKPSQKGNVQARSTVVEQQVRHMVETREEEYLSEDGWSMKRENGTTPNGNPMGGRWVLRDAEGSLIDFDQYRYDLEGRCHIRLIST
jgi:hypothetical protein